MNQLTIKELQKKQPSQCLQTLLEQVVKNVGNSRSAMSQYYGEWDAHHETFKARRVADKEDEASNRQGLPTKLTMPMTQAQAMTFVSFAFILLTQNKRFFELMPIGVEDHELREVSESLLERDLAVNQYKQVLFQFLLNVVRFGVGVVKDYWYVDRRKVHFTVESQGTELSAYRDVVKFAGNKICNVSPYKFFPDPAFPIQEFQRGSFVASEDEYSRHELLMMEAQNFVAGIEHVEPFSSEAWGKRKKSRLSINKPEESKDTVCITEMQMTLVPADYKDDEGNKILGDETFPIKYVIWVANDNRIVRCMPMGYLHDSYTYSVGTFTPDNHELIGQSLAGIVHDMQRVISWLLNSRVAAVSRTIDNRLVVDPSAINMASVEANARVITLKKSAALTGVDRYIQQLPVQDTTGGHVADANNLISLLQLITGVNENAMGQFHGGRRSATEARSVMQGAAARMKMIVDLLWTNALAPQGQRLLANLRQSIDQETFSRFVGQEATPDLFAKFKGAPEDVVQATDFFMFEGTLPSEKAFLAQSLQELLGLVMANPQASAMFNMDPNKLLKEIYTLRGANGLARFSYDDALQRAALLQGQMDTGAQNNSGAPQV